MRDLHFNPPTPTTPDPRDELLADVSDTLPAAARVATSDDAATDALRAEKLVADEPSLDVSVFASDALPATDAATTAEAAVESQLIASRSVAAGPTMALHPRTGTSGATSTNAGRGAIENLSSANSNAAASPLKPDKQPSTPKYANTARVRPVFADTPPPPPPERDDDATPLAAAATADAPTPDDFAGLAVAGGDEPVRPRSGAWWAVPLMCAGLALIAAALLIPAADENRRLAYEMEKIQRDVEFFERQSAVNKDFLDRIGNDPALVERLAQRQLRRPRENTRLIQSPAPDDTFAMSPAALVAVDPPAPMPPYTAPVGRIAEWCRDPRLRLYLLGGAAFAVATGVVLGSPTRRTKALAAPPM